MVTAEQKAGAFKAGQAAHLAGKRDSDNPHDENELFCAWDDGWSMSADNVRTPVGSSNIRSIGYSDRTQVLEIEFTGGRIYQYANVPKSMYSALMGAASHGKYFNAHIKHQFEVKEKKE